MENKLSVKASELDQAHHNQIATNLKLKEAKAKVAEAEKEKAKLRGEVNKSKQEADKLKVDKQVHTQFLYSVVFAICQQSIVI